MDPSAKWGRADNRRLMEVDERVGDRGLRGHKHMREKEERTSLGGQCHRRGREKRKEGESGNNQIVKQGGASGEKVVSSSPLSSSPRFLPHLCLFLCFSLFSTYPPQLHFQNHILILKIHSSSPSDKWHSFLQKLESENLEKHESCLQSLSWLPQPSRSPKHRG